MQNDTGWIKISRKFLDWEWYDNAIVKSVFLHLILTANIKQASWHGITVERGQVITSYGKIAAATGHSVQEVRTAIKKLISTQCVTQSQAVKSSLFTIINYDFYQSATQLSTGNQQGTNNELTGNQQATNNNQRNKEIKKGRTEEINTPLPPTGENGGEIQNQGESLKALKTAGGNTRHSTTLDENFALFWAAYPRKVSKTQALKAWQKLKPDKDLTEKILKAIEAHKKSDQWRKDNGQYIPYPATWLNGSRWEDEIQTTENRKDGKNEAGYISDNQRGAKEEIGSKYAVVL